jgi:hypothetical protein
MPARRLSHPDPSLVLDQFSAAEREIIAGWSLELGLDPDGVLAIATTMFATIAAMRIATRLREETPGLASGEAIRAAAKALGMKDADQQTHPGDSLARVLRRWITRQSPGHNVRTRSDNAA